jgi:hypothetical protein
MKLHPSQRSPLAERICRRWIRRRKVKIPTPKVYLVKHMKTRHTPGTVWGWCHYGKGLITIHYAQRAHLKDLLIVLAHEYAHHEHWASSAPKWRRIDSSHGERFWRIFWGTLPRIYWEWAYKRTWSYEEYKERRYQP